MKSMPALIPQEVYLLERYTSKEYFIPMRDAWERMIEHAEACLEVFVNNLPGDYRGRPLWQQPDIVWGERVLPNFRETLDSLSDGYIRLTHGDKQALGAAGHVESDFTGFSRDYSVDWMDEHQVAEAIPDAGELFWKYLGEALTPASNIETTITASWPVQFLGSRYQDVRGPLNPPNRWPKYRLDLGVQVSTGQLAPRTGFYLPMVDQASPQFWIAGNEVFEALVGLNEDGTQYRERMPVNWILIERVPDEFVDDPLANLLADKTASVYVDRVPAGAPCPETGWWYTPARTHSRGYFKRGETFPNIESSEYGDTFWLWAPDQAG